MKNSNFNFQIKRFGGEGKKKEFVKDFLLFIQIPNIVWGGLFGSTKKLEFIVHLPRNLFPILEASRMFIPLLLVP
jgi:hypothetical protein